MHAGEKQEILSKLMWALILFAITIGFFWKLVLTGQYTWLGGNDEAYQILPWYQYQAAEWRQGRFPLWDPYLWGGQPLVGQAQPGAAYPPNWILFLLPLRNGWIRQGYLHWYFVLIHFQAVVSCYWLCRDLRRTRAASLLAGLVFGLSGYIGSTSWPQMLNGAVWAPLILLFFLRAMRGERPVANSAVSGTLLGVSVLSGHHQIPIYIALTMGGCWIYFLLREGLPSLRKLSLAAVFGIFALLTSGLQTLPAYEYGRLSLRWAGAPNALGWKDIVPYAVHQQFSLYANSLPGIVVPGLSRNADPFIGLVAVAMGLLAIGFKPRDPTVRLFGAIAFGGLLFSLGHQSVFHGIFYALIPMVEKARSASMAIFIFHFGISVLVAYGTDSYSDSKVSAWATSAVALAGVCLAIGTYATGIAKIPVDERLGASALVALLLAGVLAAWRRDHVSTSQAVAFLTVLMCLECGNVSTYGYTSTADQKSNLHKLAEHSDIAEFLRSRPDFPRAEIDEVAIPYNFGDWYGIDHYGGYLASLTENVARVQGEGRARSMYGVRFAVGSRTLRPDQELAFSSSSGLKIYRNREVFPRSWIVHQSARIGSPLDIGPRLTDA
ncbi:MAG: hypothetical protein ABIZ80_19695, partial [Bryobacteraceae bacterium]